MRTAAAIIPAYNEADRIMYTVQAAKNIPGIAEVVVVDDGSTDKTAEQAEIAGADKIIRLSRNSGKGAALDAGIKATDSDIALLLDADLAASASEAGALLTPVLQGDADMTIAVPPSMKNTGGFGFAVGLARWGIRKFTGRTMAAPLSGQRAILKQIIDRMGGFDKGFGVETGLTIDACRMGYRVVEVPVEITHRGTGKTLKGFLHRGGQFIDIARALSSRLRDQSMRSGRNA